jgi:selenocysteine lyase/cysteine desulfurase
LADDVHAQGGILLLDAAQSPADMILGSLQETDFDAAFGSGHKMYGPSVGFIVIRRTLLRSLQPFFLGGGTVEDGGTRFVSGSSSGEDEHAVLEPGLQNWSGIIGLREAAKWLQTQNIADQEHLLAEHSSNVSERSPRSPWSTGSRGASSACTSTGSMRIVWRCIWMKRT